jgi:hypothetical protein
MSKITIKSLQAIINDLKNELEAAHTTNDSYLVDSQTRDLQDIALKKELEDERVLRQHNEEALTRLIDQRDNEIQDLRKELRGSLTREIEGKKEVKPTNPQADKLVQGGRDPVVIHTDPVAVFKGMDWALRLVKFPSTVDAGFFDNYMISINKEGKWFSFLPFKENAETKAFAKEFVDCARAEGYEKANYKQGGGAWFIYKK